MKNEHPISVTKLIIYTIMPLQRPITGFLLFFAGIAIGITLRSHLKDFSFTYSLDPQLSLPNPLPLTSLWSPTQETTTDSGNMGTVKINNFMGQDHKEDDDQDLINRVLKMDSPAIRGSTPAGKVAFLFLTKGSLPMAPLWEKFFEKHKGNFSVYVHTHPLYNWTLPKRLCFYGSIIPSKHLLLLNGLAQNFVKPSYDSSPVGGKLCLHLKDH
ncbi:uncharacterized protein LOC124935588 [Impatiens glandulifera]|uniref:uncharacterized protein LOC124935588 n=1 Tax=Impatiens glandulifera TaxID=253017 RepID=UPI001FB04EC4|nr:uncharacterized protein LOC124935588 [Impatiens glandulifera]